MNYEQIFAGQVALGQAIKHLCNRSLALRPDGIHDRAVHVSSDKSQLPKGIRYWMPLDERDAVAVLQCKFLELDAEFKQKKTDAVKRRSRRCA